MEILHAQAKDAPDYAAFSLEAAIFDDVPERLKNNALRCIEVKRAERDHVPMPRASGRGMMIPDSLLLSTYRGKQLRAATVNLADVAGAAVQEQTALWSRW